MSICSGRFSRQSRLRPAPPRVPRRCRKRVFRRRLHQRGGRRRRQEAAAVRRRRESQRAGARPCRPTPSADAAALGGWAHWLARELRPLVLAHSGLRLRARTEGLMTRPSTLILAHRTAHLPRGAGALVARVRAAGARTREMRSKKHQGRRAWGAMGLAGTNVARGRKSSWS